MILQIEAKLKDAMLDSMIKYNETGTKKVWDGMQSKWVSSDVIVELDAKGVDFLCVLASPNAAERITTPTGAIVE